MTYEEKADKFKELAYKANSVSGELKWRNREALSSYLVSWGGRIKEDRRRRRGYLVCLLQESREANNIFPAVPALVAEVPMDFAEKVISMGGFP